MRERALRAIRTVKLVARDPRIPRPLRALAGIGLLPIPGPFDEALLLVLAPILFGFYREPMRDAWAGAGEKRIQAPASLPPPRPVPARASPPTPRDEAP